jgi:predicted nucleic acid-binding Zn ribbon protein
MTAFPARRPHALGAPAGAARRRGGTPSEIGDVVPEALKSLGLAPRAVSKRMESAWAQASEGRWAGKTRPVRWQGGVLFVEVTSEPLKAELTQFHAERLLPVLRTLLPDDPIVGLRFEAGRADPEAR